MIKNIVEMNSNTFSILMFCDEIGYPFPWLYRVRYWDLVISFLNRECRSIAALIYSEFDLEFLQISDNAPTIEGLTALIKEDLMALNLDIMKEFVNKIFVDNTYPKLSAAQKYCALMDAWKHDDSVFSDFLGVYNYTATVSPHYAISDGLSEFAYDTARDVGDDIDSATIAEGVYALLCEALSEPETKDSAIKVHKSFDFPSLHDTVSFLLHEMVQNNCIVKKCPNCNRYFVPENRSDTIYCGQPSPQQPTKTCQEYTKYANYLKKTQFDEATKLYKQIYNIMNNKARRCHGINDLLNDNLQGFIEFAKQWKSDVKTGAKTEAEYIAWLKAVKEKKVTFYAQHNKAAE